MEILSLAIGIAIGVIAMAIYNAVKPDKADELSAALRKELDELKAKMKQP